MFSVPRVQIDISPQSDRCVSELFAYWWSCAWRVMWLLFNVKLSC